MAGLFRDTAHESQARCCGTCHPDEISSIHIRSYQLLTHTHIEYAVRGDEVFFGYVVNKGKLYAEYRAAKEERAKLLTVKANLELILDRNPHEIEQEAQQHGR